MAHHHHHGGCEHEAADEDHAQEMGIEYSLYKKIDIDNVECLNEEIDDSGKLVFKPYEERLNFDKFVQSDDGPELLFNIPFTGNIKLKGIIVIGNNDNSHPEKLRMFKNRPNMCLDDIGLKADQEFDLHRDPEGIIEYSTKIVTFSSLYHLTLHFPTNYGEDHSRINYIGLRGEFSEAHNHGVTICNYEILPNASNHKSSAFDSAQHSVK